MCRSTSHLFLHLFIHCVNGRFCKKDEDRLTQHAMYVRNFINALLLCIFNSFFMVAGIFLNSVVVISLWKSSQLRRKLCYFTIFVLSWFDLGLVMIAHPTVIISAIYWSNESYNAEIELTRAYISILFGGFSMFALLTLNVERFLALNYPFFHQNIVTEKKLVLFLVILIIVLVSLSPMIYLEKKSIYIS